MDTPDRQPGSGDTRFTGTSTGQVHVGRFILDLPSPGGTTLSLAPRGSRTEPPAELTAALARDTPDAKDTRGAPEASAAPDGPAERDFAERANQLLDTAEGVTDTIEHVTDTVQALLAGRIPDPELISGDLAESLGLMQRLAQSGRFAEVIKLGRPLCRLFGLTLRWAALVESLRLTFHAATALADTPTIAWTQHELGTLHGSVGDVDRARELLKQARRTREAIGDEDGLRATDHNLRLLCCRGLIPKSTAAFVGVGVVVVIVVVLAVAETVGGGSAPSSVLASTTSSRTHTRTPRVDFSSTSHTTSVATSSAHQATGSPSAVPRPRTVKFAATTIGQSASTEVDLVNTGSGQLTVTSAQIAAAGGAFAITSDTCRGQTIAAGAFCTVTVTFTPAAAGDATGSLTFTDNAEPATQQVQLFATGESQTLPPTTTPTVATTPTTPTNPSSGQTTTQSQPVP